MVYHLGTGTGLMASLKGKAKQGDLSQFIKFGDDLDTEEQQSAHLKTACSWLKLCLEDEMKS